VIDAAIAPAHGRSYTAAHVTHLPSTIAAADVDCIGTKPVLVWVLAPFVATSDPTLDYYNDYSQSQAEFARAFDALGMAWRWQPVAMHDFREVIDSIARETTMHVPVVFNLCDGDETNGVPGISVIRHLDDVGLPYTGADQHFYHVTTSKVDMKHAFDAAGVPTAPWEVIPRGATALGGAFKRRGSPLIVKPAISAGSMGITVDSVVTSATALRKQVRLLDEGYRGWDLASGGVFVERYIVGPEFTTLIVGCADAPDRSVVFPAVERVFHAALPPTEQFLSFDRLWEVYERESPLGEGEYLWQYGAAPAELQQRICDVSWEAYRSVGGRGYGRVDVRMDSSTGELFVLEVNAQCGLSEDENYTSIGAILRLAGRSFSSMVRDIVADAVATRTAIAGQQLA
jgi:D-alanine-D-alanine ligase